VKLINVSISYTCSNYKWLVNWNSACLW